jgi:hypothetical protein
MRKAIVRFNGRHLPLYSQPHFPGNIPLCRLNVGLPVKEIKCYPLVTLVTKPFTSLISDNILLIIALYVDMHVETMFLV